MLLSVSPSPGGAVCNCQPFERQPMSCSQSACRGVRRPQARACALLSLCGVFPNGHAAPFGGTQIEGVYNDSTKQESRIGKRVEIEECPQVSSATADRSGSRDASQALAAPQGARK